MPVPLRIWAIKGDRVRVQFDSPVLGIGPYLNPDNYVFVGGLEALSVFVIKPDTIEVTTTPQITDALYKLKVKPDA